MVNIKHWKHGRCIVGTRQTIVAPSVLREYEPEVVFHMNPIYREEVRSEVNRVGLDSRSRKSPRATFKNLAKSRLRRFPRILSLGVKTWRRCRLLWYKGRWKLVAFTGSLKGTYARGIDVDRVCSVSPQRIVYRTSQYLKSRHFKGHVIPGDWDRLENRFEDRHEYMFFKEVCVEGKDWTETIAYQQALDSLERGETLWYAKDRSGLEQRCRNRVALFESIKREGYKSQSELLLSHQIDDPLQAEEEVTVSIGRHGDLLFSAGGHRLAIAKLLDIERIPVKIALRHPEWVRFREELLLYAEANGGKVPQPIRHPDLDDIPASDGCEETFRLIKDSMSARQGRLLDIGAKWGYYCHRFEDEGFDCWAVEDSQANVYFLRKLRRAENKRFRTIPKSVLESPEIRNTQFAVVLAVNALDQFLMTRVGYDRLVDLLKDLRTEELFFQPDLTDKAQMQCAYKSYAADEFVEFLLEHSRLDGAERIGVTQDGWPLFRLY